MEGVTEGRRKGGSLVRDLVALYCLSASPERLKKCKLDKAGSEGRRIGEKEGE